MDVLNRVSVGIKLPLTYHSGFSTLQAEIKRRGADSTFRNSGMTEMGLFACVPGDLSGPNVLRIVEVVKKAAESIAPFEVRFAGVTGEPNAVQPRSAALGVEGGEPFVAIAAAVYASGIVPTSTFTGYVPKIEIGRLKQLTDTGRINLGRAIKMAAKPEFPPLKIEFVEVLISQATASGPDFRVVERILLAGSGGTVVPPPILG